VILQVDREEPIRFGYTDRVAIAVGHNDVKPQSLRGADRWQLHHPGSENQDRTVHRFSFTA
jgi:hypothetical protein